MNKFHLRIVFCLFISCCLLIANPFTAFASNQSELPDKVWNKIRDQIRESAYEVSWDKEPLPFSPHGAFKAYNQSQKLWTYFTSDGVRIISEKSESNCHLGMHLLSYGYEGALEQAFRVEPEALRNRVEYRYGRITEWYVNDERGLEQGFTLLEKPASGNHGSLLVEMSLSGSLASGIVDQRGNLVFKDERNHVILRYGGLKVWDANGRILPAHFSLNMDEVTSHQPKLAIFVDDSDALYPITIDPLVTSEVAKMTPSDAESYKYFGYSVAVSGDVMVVGATRDTVNGAWSGAAYIFERNFGGLDNWGEVKKLLPANGEANDNFGHSVSICKDTIVVGAPYAGIGDGGAAYIFDRNNGGADNWGQVQEITASGLSAGDWFGVSVSIDNDTIAVGTDAESAYVFERNQGGVENWGQMKAITSSDNVIGDTFGHAVSVSNDTIVVGAYADDDAGTSSGSAYVYSRNQGGADNWGQVQKLLAADGAEDDEFGNSVSIYGGTVVVGAHQDDDTGANSGSAYVFSRNQGGADNWGQVKKLADSGTSYFGRSVSVDHDRVAVGVYGSNLTYIFERNKGGVDNWGEDAQITPSDGVGSEYFGESVSISGDTIVVGAYGDDDDGDASGSAYVFNHSGDTWIEYQKPIASDGADGDFFGYSVSISNDTMVVGANRDDNFSGSAYIFSRNQGGADNWGQVTKITASDSADNDFFGISVSISNDTVVVGASSDDDNGGQSGSAYVFSRNQGGVDNWGQVRKLLPSDGVASDEFGYSVSISNDTVVVGAWGVNSTSSAGSAYIFSRNQGGSDNWGEVVKLTASDAAISDYFGCSVSISNDTVVVGAYGDDDNGSASGSAYIFSRNQEVADDWGQVAKITALDGADLNLFGASVSISNDTVVVGAHGDDDNGVSSGSAYIFSRNQGGLDTWGQVAKITASDGASGAWFGYSVSISNDTVLVGASYDDDIGADSGSAYIYSRNQGGIDNWGQVTKITASDGAATDVFGTSISISNDTVVVGASSDDDNGDGSGSSYVYKMYPQEASDTVSFMGPVNYTAEADTSSVAIGDLNEDGNPDLAAVSNDTNQISVFFGNGDGTFQAAIYLTTGTYPEMVVIRDLNGDSNLDLVTSNAFNSVSILLGNGDGTFQAAVPYVVSNFPKSVAIEDLNGDGYPDLATANFNQDNASVLLGNGDGTFQAEVTYAAGNGPDSIAIRDLNGDTFPDLAVANQMTYNVSILLGNGDGTFQAAVNYSAGANPYWIGIEDLNGDTLPDLAVINAGDDTVSVFLGNGDGTFQTAVNYGTGTDPLTGVINDLNDDSIFDLIVANWGDDNVSVLLGNGDGTFQTAINFATGDGPMGLAVDDLNGDGQQDMATANSLGGNISILLSGSGGDDSDADGMDDQWEMDNFGDLSRDGTGDEEGDLLTNLDEYANNTDPNDEDSDGDGYYDGEEISLGSIPTDGQDIPAYNPGAYYVDADAANLGDGTMANPWRILRHAVDVINDGSAGDYTLYVDEGVYTSINNDGFEPDEYMTLTQGNVAVIGSPGAVLDGNGNITCSRALEISASNVNVSGLEIINFNNDYWNGIVISSGDMISIDDCTIRDGYSALTIESGASNVSVTNCTISGHRDGITMEDDSTTIAYNVIYNSSAYGVSIREYHGNNITPVIVNNLIYSTEGYGIMLYTTNTPISPLIAHNTIYGGDDGIYINGEDSPAMTIQYNIISEFAEYGIRDEGAAQSNPVLELNNVYSSIGNDNYLNVTPGATDISEDPLYVDAAGNDFHLQPGSSCIDAILTDSFATDDLDGNIRPLGSGYDMGAYEQAGDGAPYVISIGPVNGAVGIGVDSNVWFIMSENVDQATVNASSMIVETGGTQVSGSYTTNGPTVTLLPDSALEYGTVYQVRITTDVTDTGGTPLREAFAWSFTTQGIGAQGAYFPSQTIISTDATTAFSVTAADIDDDGDLDVLSASDDDNTVEWFGNTDGQGTFGPPATIWDSAVGARSVYAGDITGDTVVDVLSASWGPTNGSNPGMEFAWYENAFNAQQSGNFSSQNVLAYHSSPISIVGADLDNDGDMDVLAASYGDNTVAWFENMDGTGGSWTEHTISSTISGAWDVFAADLDNDGDLDVLSAANGSNGISWFENRLSEASQDFGSEVTISDSTYTNGARVVRAADLDQDGAMDVISASWFDGEISWYKNLGGGFGDPATNQNIIATANENTQAMHVADLDNDGDVDVFYASWGTDHTIYWMENADASGTTWTSHEISAAVDGCQSLYAADLDNDGDLDVLSASQDDNKIAWYENINTMPISYTLTVNQIGQGSVDQNPAGTIFDPDAVVNLTAIPDVGWEFSQWSGSISSSELSVDITMDADKIITAVFVENQPPDPPIVEGPEDESTIPDGSPITLDAGAYHDPEDDLHENTHWMVWRADSGEIMYEDTSTVDKEKVTLTPLDPGLKYEWQVEYEDAVGKTSASAIYSFKVGTPEPDTLPEVAAGKSLGDFGMISIVHWPNDPDPQAVFNIDYDPNNYRIGAWDPEKGQYIEYGNGLEMEPGRAVWVLARNNLVVHYNGIEVSREHYIEVCLHTDAATGTGYNMIAPPNAADYDWRQIEVGVFNEDDGIIIPEVAISELTDDLIIDRKVWEWSDGEYQSHMNNTSFVLKHYKGYWVKAMQKGAYLVFPIHAQATNKSPAKSTMLAWKGRAVQWIKDLLPQTSEAIADSDSPPMPMGLFEDSVDPVFEGCFIETVDLDE